MNSYTNSVVLTQAPRRLEAPHAEGGELARRARGLLLLAAHEGKLLGALEQAAAARVVRFARGRTPCGRERAECMVPRAEPEKEVGLVRVRGRARVRVRARARVRVRVRVRDRVRVRVRVGDDGLRVLERVGRVPHLTCGQG